MSRFAQKSHYLLKRENIGIAVKIFIDSFALSCNRRMDHRIQQILTQIENDISQRFVIGDLAASVNLSASRLQYLFKKEVKTSIIKYINNLRLQKACKLLQASHLHVKEISTQVGATNESHFHRDFKKKFGQTPTNYRQIFQNSRNGQ